MSENVNQFVGILGTKKSPWAIIGGEQYYMTTIEFEEPTVPIVLPKYFFDVFSGQKVTFYGFPRETRKRVNGTKMVFVYLYCLHMEAANDEDEFCRGVELTGTVVSVGELKLSAQNDSKLIFKIKYDVAFNKPVTVLAPCRAFSYVARSLMPLSAGDVVHVMGLLAGTESTMRVVAKHVDKITVASDALGVDEVIDEVEESTFDDAM